MNDQSSANESSLDILAQLAEALSGVGYYTVADESQLVALEDTKPSRTEGIGCNLGTYQPGGYLSARSPRFQPPEVTMYTQIAPCSLS